MKFQCIAVPVLHPESQLQALNQFIAQHRILSVDKVFSQLGDQGYWCFCISYSVAESSSPTSLKRQSIDYREVLSPEKFAVYSRLRSLRKTIAAEDGIPAYAIFTNEQIAAMTDLSSPCLQNMSGISGVGPSRIEKYGNRFLTVLKETGSKGNQQGGEAT